MHIGDAQREMPTAFLGGFATLGAWLTGAVLIAAGAAARATVRHEERHAAEARRSP